VSSVLRLNTLLDRSFKAGDHRLEAISAEIGVLDRLCKTLGVTELSRFIDTTAIELIQAVELLDDDAPLAPAAEPTTDPETGLAYGIEDMSWQPIAAGMSSLEALQQHIERGLHVSSQQPQLLQELTYCIQALAPLEAEGGQFHLAVIPA